jgi:hypothetical protein
MKAFRDLEAKKLKPLWGLLWVLRFKNLCEKRGDVCSEISFWPVCH